MARLLVAALLLVLAVSLVAVRLKADDNRALESQLNKTYKGTALTLRKFYCGSKLQFDAAGGLVKGGKIGPWTLCGRVQVTNIKYRGQTLEIEAERILLFYDSDKPQPLGLKGEPVNTKMQLSESPTTLQAVQPHLAKVFLASNEDLASFVPDYWRYYLARTPVPPVTAPAPKTGINAQPPVLTAPAVIQKVEPQYTEAARNARLEGRTVLWLVVDAKGDVGTVWIVRPLGLGLDENAVDAVRTWKFKPATRDGVPVATRIMVETVFRFK